MKKKYVYSNRQLIGKALKLSAKNHASLKSVQEAVTKRTNVNWYSNEEAANYTGYSIKTLYRYRKQGMLNCSQSIINGNVRYRKTDLDKFLKLVQNGR